MIQDFPNGTLNLSGSPAGEVLRPAVWSDSPVAVVACALGIISLILAIRPLSEVWKMSVNCAVYGRPNTRLERNLSMKRKLDIAVALLSLPTLTICARFGVFGSSVPVSLGLLAGYFALRALMYRLLRHRKIDRDIWESVTRGILSPIVIVSVSILCTFALFYVADIGEDPLRTVLRIEVGIGIFLTMRQLFEILRLHFSRFSTFLYLCALEFLPAAAFVATALVLQY